jgi:phage-related protein
MNAPMVKGMEALKKFLKGIQESRDVTQMYRERLLGVVGASNEMEIKTRKLAESFSQFLPIIAAVGTGLSIFFGKGLLQGIPVIGNLVGGLNPLLGALVALVLTTPPLQEALVNLFKAFAPLKEVAMGVAQIFGGIFSFAVATLIGLINGLAGVVSTVSQFLARNAEAVKIVVGTLAGMAIAYTVLTGVMNAYKTVLGIVKSVQQAYAFMTYATTVGVTGFRKAMEILNMVIAKNPIMALVIVVGVLVAAFAYAWKTSETFRNVMTQVFDQVAKVVGSVIAFVLNTLAGLLEGFARVMGQGGALRDLFVLVFNGIIKIVGTVIAGVINYFADLLLAFSSLISSGSFIAKAFTTVFTFIGEVIKNIVVYAIRMFANWVGLFAGLLEAVGEFGKGFTQGFNKIGDVVADFGRGVLKILGKLLKGVFSAAGNLVKGIVDAIKGVFKGGNNSAEEAAKNMGSWTDTVFKFANAGAKALRGIQKGLNSTANGISKVNIGNFADSLITGLSNGAKTAGTFLKSIAKRIQDFADKDWGSGVADALVKAALVASAWLRSAATSVLDFTSEGFTQNLTEGIGSFLDLVEGMFTNLKGTIGGESETLFDPITDAMDDIADGADGAAQRAADRLKRITDAAKSALSEIQKQAQEVLAFSDQVKKGINDFGGIASLSPDQGVPVTANMIIDNMRQRLAKITKFGNDLRALAGLGLNNASLQELISAGPVAGGAMAAALLKEGQSAVSQVNTFQSGIDLAGSAIGDIAARSQFGMGTEEAKGVIETRIEVKEGAVQIVFGSNIDSETRGDIRETVNEAIREAMAELAREIANQRAS